MTVFVFITAIYARLKFISWFISAARFFPRFSSLILHPPINHPPVPGSAVFSFSLHLRGRETFPELRDISSVSLPFEPIGSGKVRKMAREEERRRTGGFSDTLASPSPLALITRRTIGPIEVTIFATALPSYRAKFNSTLLSNLDEKKTLVHRKGGILSFFNRNSIPPNAAHFGILRLHDCMHMLLTIQFGEIHIFERSL